MLSSSQHKQAAVEALQFLTSTAAQKQLNLNWGYTPTRLSVFEDPELVRANPVLPELKAALAAAVLRPVTPIYAQLSDLLYREVNTVITGEVAAAPAMETLQRNSIQLERSTGGIS